MDIIDRLLRPPVSDREHIASVVGIPQSREFTQVETQGDVRQYAAPSGSRINIDSKGQFYDGELRPIDRETASSYQRMTTEWQAHPHEDTGKLLEHLKRFSQPTIDQYVQEQKIVGLQSASPAQQEELGVRLQQRLGLAADSASLAVIKQVIETKEVHGVRATSDESMEFEYRLDTLRGKAGPHYMREVREEDYARKFAGPALETFAAKNNVTVGQFTEDQLQQVGKELSQKHQIPLDVATTQVSHLHREHEQDTYRRDLILDKGVGSEKSDQYTWKQSSGDIESYQHKETGRFIHIDSSGEFYNQQRQSITQTAALDHAMGPGKQHAEVIQHKHDNGLSL